MPPLLGPALKKHETVRVFTTDQKLWLIDLSDKNPEFEHIRLAQKIRDKFGGDLLSSSTVSDWLKRVAVKRVHAPDTRYTRRTRAVLAHEAKCFAFPVVQGIDACKMH